MRLLDGAGIVVRGVSLSSPTLDDVFLRQTGRSLREADELLGFGVMAALALVALWWAARSFRKAIA